MEANHGAGRRGSSRNFKRFRSCVCTNKISRVPGARARALRNRIKAAIGGIGD